MKQLRHKLALGAGLAIFAIALVLPTVAGAHGIDPQDPHHSSMSPHEMAQAETKTEREATKARLEGAKLRVCQNRTKAITNIMARIANRGQKQLDLFTTIAERTQNFYTQKGKVLGSYDALVAEVNAKKAAAQAAIDEIKNSSGTFDCSGDNPKGAADAFKESLRTEQEALKAYKTAVKNLIVGVKSVQSTRTGGEQ